MNKLKQAFTLTEIIITIAIMGILFVISLSYIINSQEKTYHKLYVRAYNTLLNGSEYIKNDVIVHNDKVRDIALRDHLQPDPADMETYPYKLDDYIEKLASEPHQKEGSTETISGYMNTTAYNKNQTYTIANLDNDNEINLTPTFIASNGMRYYFISGQYNTQPTNDITRESNYFIVWIDLNGPRSPNITRPKYNSAKTQIVKRPDIVPFAIYRRNGQVLPLGYPTYDPMYMLARTEYADPDVKKAKIFRAYNDARYAAYLGYRWNNDVNSMNFNSVESSSLNFTTKIPSTFKQNNYSYDNNCYSPNNKNTSYPPCTLEIR